MSDLRTFAKAHGWVVIPACAVLCLLLMAYALSKNHRALDAANRRAENSDLALKQQIVAHQETKAQLDTALASLLKQKPQVAEAVSDAKAAAPSAKPVAVVSLATKPVAVVDAPRSIEPEPPHPEPLPPCIGIYTPDGMGGWYCAQKELPKQTCVLTSHDQVSFKISQVVLKTDLGNSLVAGNAELWREVPNPALLASGKFSSSLSDVQTLAPPAEPRWGASLDGACGASGCGLGASVLFPPWRVMGKSLEARLGGLTGPAPAILGGVGLRF